MALLGRVDHSLDEKGRLVVPAIFRDDLDGKLFFALGDENEVAVWPDAEFNEKLEQKKAREKIEFTLGDSFVRVEGEKKLKEIE